MFAVNAAAILLPVKAILLRELTAPLEIIAVVTVEELHSRFAGRIIADGLDELMVLMRAYEQRRREEIISAVLCHAGRLFQALAIADPAALVFTKSNVSEKSLEIVLIVVDYPQMSRIRELLHSLNSFHVLLVRVNVRIEEVAVDIETLLPQLLNGNRGTGRTTDVK